MLGKDIGIDLGTATVLIFLRGKGVILREPSVVAIDQNTGRVLAVGEEAKRMLGRTPGHVVAVRPLRDGVIANYTMTEAMLRHFLGKVSSSLIFQRRRPPRVSLHRAITMEAVISSLIVSVSSSRFWIAVPPAARTPSITSLTIDGCIRRNSRLISM